MLWSHKIRSTLYSENTLHEVLCKPKDQVVKEDNKNIAHEFDCSNCEADCKANKLDCLLW